VDELQRVDGKTDKKPKSMSKETPSKATPPTYRLSKKGVFKAKRG